MDNHTQTIAQYLVHTHSLAHSQWDAMLGPNLSPIGSSAHLYPLPALSYLSAVRPTDRIVPHLLRGSLPLFEPLTPTSPVDFSSGSVLFAVRHCYGPHSATPAPQVPATI